MVIFCFGPSAGYDENYAVGKAAGKYWNVLNADLRNERYQAPLLHPIEKVRA